MIHTAGRFTFDDETGQIGGPKRYICTEAFQSSFDKIQAGESVVVNMAPAGIPIGQLIATALQTDFAAWLGKEELELGLDKGDLGFLAASPNR